MQTIEFKYQNIKLRMLSLIPFAVIWPLANSLLTDILDLTKLESGLVSLVLLYLVLRLVCLFNGKFFTKTGSVSLSETQTTMKLGKEELTIANDDILQLRAERIGVFGRKVACFKIKYKESGAEKIYSIYSDDLGVRNVQECSAWDVYATLKKDIFGK